MKKKLLIALAVVVVLLIAGIVAVVLSIDAITRRGIERGGEYATGVRTELSGAHLGLTTGELTMDDLTIANPDGYAADHFLTLEDGFVAVTLGSLLEERVVVPKVELRGVQLSVERTGDGNNFDKILDHLRNLPTAPPEEAKKFVINELVIRDAVVTIRGFNIETKPVPLPTIRLTDVGSGGEGKAVHQVVGIVIRELFQTLLRDPGAYPEILQAQLANGLEGLGDLGNVGVEMIGGVTDRVGEELGKVGEAVGGVSPEAKEALDDVGGRLDQGVKDLGDGLGGLLGGKKKDDADAE